MGRLRTSSLILAANLLAWSGWGAVDPWDRAAEIVESIKETSFPDRDFSILDFGADPNGSADSLPAVTAAIASAHEAGGGRVLVPAGLYHLEGPIVLQSNVNLHLAEGSELRFSGEPDDFLPAVFQRWEGTEVYNYSPFLYALNEKNIAVTGQGIINGNVGETFGQWRPDQKPAQKRLREMGGDRVPVSARRMGEGDYLRPSLLQFVNCQQILIEGVTFTDSPFWVIHPVYCTDVIVRGVVVDSTILNNDGFDPDSCERVLVEDCRFSTGDDAIAIKAGRDADGRAIGRPSREIVIRNCTFDSKINGLSIGSEMSGGVYDIFMENIEIPNSTNAIYFKSNRDRGGEIRNVYVRNIRLGTAREAVVRFEPDYKGYRGGSAYPVFRDIVIENVVCDAAPAFGILIEGHPREPVRNVILRNIQIGSAAHPFWGRGFERLTLSNVRVNGEVLVSNPKPVAADAERPVTIGH